MSALSIQIPYPVFTDENGQPLEDGYVWIGQPYLDPQTNPVQVYFDDALTIPAAQPLRTIGGYVSNSGTPAQLYINGVNFSIRVQTKNGVQVYAFPDGSGINPDAAGVTYNPGPDSLMLPLGPMSVKAAFDNLTDDGGAGASYIGFLQAGTNAQPTTVQAKLRETVSVLDFGADATGVADSTAAIQAAIDSLTTGTVVLPPGTYRTTANVTLKSGVNIVGNGATMTCTTSWASGGSFFELNNVSDVFISGVTFDAGGTWTATPFANPYGGGNSVGFTNNQAGILILGSSSNIRIENNTFTGLGRGAVAADQVDSLLIRNNFIDTMGSQGFYLERCTFTSVIGNVIKNILGQLTAAGDTNTANSNVADAVYLRRVSDVVVSGNTIENITRIGVVLEGDGVTLNKRVSIVGNTFKLMQNCRGTEFNAAVWSEFGKSEASCVVSGNVMDNTGAITGARGANAINSFYLTITGNTIKSFAGYGVNGYLFEMTGNVVEYCGVGVGLSSQPSSASTFISGNKIQFNGTSGVIVDDCRGNITISNNIIKDNGQTSTLTIYKSGVLVDKYYFDQYLEITSNTFISSANEGATQGQLYAVLGRRGGDFACDFGRTVTRNSFKFSGVFASAYPNNLAVVPSSFCYNDTVANTFDPQEVSPDNNFGNTNDKFIQGTWRNYSSGWPLFCGYDNTPPVSGSYRKGDFLLSENVTAGGFIGWICTTAGTPGTWKTFGAISA